MDTNTEDLRNDMADTADSARRTAGTAAELARDTAKAVGAEVSARVGDTVSSLRDGAAERLEATRDAISDSGDKLAESLRRATPPDSDTLQARVLGAAADGLQSVAGELRDYDFSHVVDDVQRFAQRNPAAFAAGAALAGFVVARFLKASAEK